MTRIRISLVCLVAAVACMSTPTPAGAAWSSAGNGSAAGRAFTMPAGFAPTARVAGGVSTVVWNAATFPDGTRVAAYIVHRYNALNGAQATTGGTCAGLVAATSCTEAVPAGSWIYSDTPVEFSWTGAESPPSNTITA